MYDFMDKFLGIKLRWYQKQYINTIVGLRQLAPRGNTKSKTSLTTVINSCEDIPYCVRKTMINMIWKN